MSDIAVVGAGPSGLGAAYRLREAGHRVHVFDSRNYPGGKMRTTHRDGFVIDEGPGIMPSGYHNILGIAAESGMGDDVLRAGSIFGFAGRNGLHYLDADRIIRSGLRFDLLSFRSKLGLARLTYDALRDRRRFSFEDLSAAAEFDSETCAEYALRRADEDVLHYIVDPTVRALVGASAAVLSAVEFRFGFAKFVGNHYKIFAGGMGSYAHHIAALLDMHLECTVVGVSEKAGSVEVGWVDAAGAEHTESFDGCVIAADGKTTRRIHRGLDDERAAFLDRMTYTVHVNVCAALSKAPPDVPAFCLNVPESVHPGLIVMTLDHNKLASRVPAGKGLLGIYTSSVWSAVLREQDDDVVVKEVVGAAERVLPGIGADLEFATVHRWDPMVLQSHPGYYRELRAFAERSRDLDRRIQLAGDYHCQGSINAATAAGERAARVLLGHVGGR